MDEQRMCAECGQPIEDTGVWEIDLDAEHFQLRGLFFGDLAHLRHWAKAQEDYGPVTASPLDHKHE